MRAAFALCACAALAGCDSLPKRYSVATPVACIAPADVPKRPPLFLLAELDAMNEGQRLIAIWLDLQAFVRYADDAGPKLDGCARLR